MTQAETGTACWSNAGEGDSFWFLGTLATIRVPGEAVGDRYAMIEFVFPHGASPPLHTHPQDESYFVLEGVLTIQAGNDRFLLETGGAAAVPMGVPQSIGPPTRGVFNILRGKMNAPLSRSLHKPQTA